MRSYYIIDNTYSICCRSREQQRILLLRRIEIAQTTEYSFAIKSRILLLCRTGKHKDSGMKSPEFSEKGNLGLFLFLLYSGLDLVHDTSQHIVQRNPCRSS